MTDREETPTPDLRAALAALPRERQPDAALEERVVRSLLASRAIGPGAAVPRPVMRLPRLAWIAASAAVLVVAAIALSRSIATRAAARGDQYVLLLYQDSAYRGPDPLHPDERINEYARWADSLKAAGHLDLAGRLADPAPGSPSGMFIVRARDDEDAARIAATCPHIKYGGKVVTRRLINRVDDPLVRNVH
jgi:hypothetical protein